MKISPISTFDPQLLGFWVVMNIINGIARGGSPCVLTKLSKCGRGTPTKVMCWMHINVYYWGKNSGLKG